MHVKLNASADLIVVLWNPNHPTSREEAFLKFTIVLKPSLGSLFPQAHEEGILHWLKRNNAEVLGFVDLNFADVACSKHFLEQKL